MAVLTHIDIIKPHFITQIFCIIIYFVYSLLFNKHFSQEETTLHMCIFMGRLWKHRW